MQAEGQLNTAAWADMEDDQSNGPSNLAGKAGSDAAAAAAADGEGEDELFANFKTMEEEQQRKVSGLGSSCCERKVRDHSCLEHRSPGGTGHAPLSCEGWGQSRRVGWVIGLRCCSC